ncbi:rhodanese-like domain-containing protein [Limnohabitans sp. 103DPR2]|jgi:phage shock protein E|uniref:rhodanese-like domain-containing protein n=1 Tax=Limnohabitans sp. 103DPR2 TaxID=1678129 RepID=UPI0007069114|nr:rhodanese-like domain-containing protein [Limnohabitans sp. 103DPR2]ALK91597.1 Thiosulfate sulfurtransferase PspE precursor [Limnohabitans sp. 103DPR2]MBU3722502.1 rhodanese-like domain-containing protein [Limnohabitans sp.]
MQQLIKEYWPFVLLILWWTYKWWRAKQVKSELPVLKSAGATLVDVRSVGEFANANAAGTVNIPLSELSSRLNEIPKDKPVVVCCASGTRSGMAKLLLLKNGYRQVHNIGNWSNLA